MPHSTAPSKIVFSIIKDIIIKEFKFYNRESINHLLGIITSENYEVNCGNNSYC